MLAELFRAARPRTTAVATPVSGVAGLGAWPFATTGPSLETVVFTDDEAEGLPVITAFLDITTALVVQMGLHAWGDNGLRLENDPVILRNPAPGPNRVLADWVREYLRASILRGNYVAVLGDNSWTGWPEVMYPVPNGQWQVEQDPSGAIIYTIAGGRYAARDVFHVIRNADTGQLYGRGLLDRNRGVVAASVAAERWAARYYTTGAVPPAQIEHPDPELTQDNAELLKSKYNAATRNREALVTPAGTKVNPLNSDAEKAQLADTRRANDAKLAIACGIPGALLGLDGPSLTYRNIVDVFQQFMTTTVMGYLEPLEQQLSTFCLPRGTEARFDVNAVLRPDIAGRVALAVQAYGAGLMTRNEGRAVIDLPPLEGPDGGLSDEQPAPSAGTPSLEVVA